MTPTLDLKALRAFADAAIPGPWRLAKDAEDAACYWHPSKSVDPDCIVVHGDYAEAEPVCSTNDDGIPTVGEVATAAFIAAFNPSIVSPLLDELVALRAENERLQARLTQALASKASNNPVPCGICGQVGWHVCGGTVTLLMNGDQ